MNWNKILTRLTRSVFDKNHRERKCIAYEDPVPNFLFDFLHLGSIHNFHYDSTHQSRYRNATWTPGGSTGPGPRPIGKKHCGQSFESKKLTKIHQI